MEPIPHCTGRSVVRGTVVLAKISEKDHRFQIQIEQIDPTLGALSPDPQSGSTRTLDIAKREAEAILEDEFGVDRGSIIWDG
jgi:hypothetical protein